MTRDLDIAPLNRETDRVMICGNPGMLADLTALLESDGFDEGNSGTPGDFVIEKAFAQRARNFSRLARQSDVSKIRLRPAQVNPCVWTIA